MNKLIFATVCFISAITLLCLLSLHDRVTEAERLINYQRAYIRDLEMRFVDEQIYKPKK